MSPRTEVIGDATLYLGDCREILPTLSKGSAPRSLLTDPPYGIGEDGGNKNRRRGYKALVVHERLAWDLKRPEPDVFRAMLEASREQIIWGGNYFADLLPPSMGWLYWDKRMGGDFSDGELAWTSQKRAVRDFSKSPFAGLRGGHEREHPTQKPVALMEWCIGFLPTNDTILDPFMGSGTTGVACAQVGRVFIGIEREPSYFDVACRRIQEAYQQPRLFAEPVVKAVQPSIFGDAA